MVPTDAVPLFREYTLAELEEIIRQTRLSRARYAPVGVPVRERQARCLRRRAP